MFIECSSLKELNLSNFNTNNLTNINYIKIKLFSNKIINKYKQSKSFSKTILIN